MQQHVTTPEEQDILIELNREKCWALSATSNTSNDHCGYIWDGILCWPPAVPGDRPSQPCPPYILGFFIQESASKLCMNDGNWFNWTDFSKCSDGTGKKFVNVPSDYNATELQRVLVPIVKNISHVGYGLSEVMLIIAFFVLATNKRLRCPRNILHLHLFVSFIIKAFMGFLKSSLFQRGVGLQSDFATHSNGSSLFHEETEVREYFIRKYWKLGNNWECKAFTTLWQYFIMANYSWILMEGLYIHNLIMWALSADSSSILVYILLGWGLPLVFVPSWAIARIFLDNEYCWTVNKDKPEVFLIIQIPTYLSLLINFVLFGNIVRLLLIKVRTSIIEEEKRYWRLAKSTLVLVALFSVPNVILLGFSFGPAEVTIVWLLCDQIFESFQGFFVALLYCFLNGEVQEEIKKKWKRFVYNGRVIDNGFPSASFTSWSSSYSMHRAPCSFLGLCHFFRHSLKPRHRSESRASKRTETLDCIVCETSPINHEASKSCSMRCKDPKQEIEGVEMKLLSNSQVV